MKKTLALTNGQNISMDLDDISMIEQGGQRESQSGELMVNVSLRSGAVIKMKLTTEAYDDLVATWNPVAI